MICWNSEWHDIGELEHEDDKVFCGECGNVFNHRAETSEGGTYSHRCGTWIELWPGKFAHCALPVHSGECIGEVVTPRPIRNNYGAASERKPMRIYTDGGYRGEIGGWGWWNSLNKESAFGSAYPTTNQRMELVAAREAIDHYLDEPLLTIVSDSAYLINVMNNKWYERWEKNGWVNSKGQAVANQDLWEALIKFTRENPTIKFEKVKGHSGDEGNDRADKLATQGILDYLMSRKKVDELREMLHVHSYLYYHLFESMITDAEWDEMAKKLVKLHATYPDMAEGGYEAELFKDWTGETGFHLTETDHVKQLAAGMLARKGVA